MKIFFFWLTRLAGMSLILVQVYKYFFNYTFKWETFTGKGLFYDLAFLFGFNLFLLAGIILIFISYKIRKKNYFTRE
jgi:hypothetical protein